MFKFFTFNLPGTSSIKCNYQSISALHAHCQEPGPLLGERAADGILVDVHTSTGTLGTGHHNDASLDPQHQQVTKDGLD